MQRLSAIDAIFPAWQHTRALILAPRRWRLLLKISALAFFAQVGGCGGSLNSPGQGMHPGSNPVVSAMVLSVLLVVGFVVLLIGLAMFYVGSRLQLVLFEVVARGDTRIGPIWSRYSRVVWKWIGLKLLLFVAFLVCLAPLLVPMIVHLARTMPAGQNGRMPPGLLPLLFELIGVLVLALVVFSISYVLLSDFAVPSFALENVPIREALRRIVLLVRGEPGQVALYVVMRVLLAMAWAMCSYLAVLAGLLILLIPAGGAGAVLWIALRHGGPAAHVLMVVGWLVLGAIVAAVVVLAFIVLLGSGMVFVQAYAVYFLSGRYPLLARLLEPGTGAPFTPPPVFPSAEEEPDDDNDGPSLPMDPALA